MTVPKRKGNDDRNAGNTGAIIMAGKVRWWLNRKKTSNRKEIGKGRK